MKFKLLTFALGLLISIAASANTYKADNNAIDALIDNAVEVSMFDAASLLDVSSVDFSSFNTTLSDDAKTKVLIAWIVDWVGLGAFGIHRHILGTKSNMWAIYTFTVCGIFGIVPVVDWWVLLIDGLILENGDKYIDNENFFMWL